MIRSKYNKESKVPPSFVPPSPVNIKKDLSAHWAIPSSPMEIVKTQFTFAPSSPMARTNKSKKTDYSILFTNDKNLKIGSTKRLLDSTKISRTIQSKATVTGVKS
jgi:hypothetical protein